MSGFVETLTLNADGNAEKNLGGVAASVQKVYAEMAKLGQGGAGAGLAGIATSAMALTPIIGEIINQAKRIFDVFVAGPIAARAAHEKLEIQLASLYSRTNDWSTSLNLAAGTLSQLQQVAVRTGEPLEGLVETFRDLGYFAGGTTEQIVGLEEKLAVVARLAGTTVPHLAHLLNLAAETGNIPRRSAAGQELAKWIGSGSALQRAYDSGDTMSFLTERFSKTREVAKEIETSWQVVGQSFHIISEGISSDFAHFWEPVKPILASMRDAVNAYFQAKHGRSGTYAYQEMGSAPADWAGMYEPAPGDSDFIGPLPEIPRKPIEVDPEKLAALTAQLQKMKDTVTTLGFAGMSRQLAQAQAQFLETTARLREENKKPMSSEEHAVLDAQIKEQAVLYQAQADEIGRAAQSAAAQRVLDTEKMWNATSAANQTGLAKELMEAQHAYEERVALDRKAIADAARNPEERVSTERKANADILASYVELLEKRRQISTKSEHDIYALTSGADIARMRAEGDALGADLQRNADEWADAIQAVIAQYGLVGEAAHAAAAATNAQFSAQATAIRRANGEATAALTGDWTLFIRNLQIELDHGRLSVQEFYQRLGDTQYRWARTAGDGVTAAMNKIVGSVKTAGQSVSDFMTGMLDSFDRGLQSMASRATSFKDFMQGLWEDLKKSFASVVADMVKRWLTGKEVMGAAGGIFSGGGATQYGGTEASDKAIMGGNVNAAQYGQYALYGAWAASLYGGISGSLGRTTGDPGYGLGPQDFGGQGGGAMAGAALQVLGATAAYTIMTAAAITATVPVIGWIVAAVMLVIAAILAIFSGPKEAVVPFNGTQIAPGASGLGGYAWQTYGQTTGSMADLMRAGGGSSAAYLNYIRGGEENPMGMQTGMPDEWIKQWQIKFHAGNADDLKGDIENFFKTVLPRMIIEASFGQTQQGYRNSATDAGYAGMEGIPAYVKGSFDPNAPIPKMLEGLGFAAQKISWVASQIDERAPDQFIKWLTSIVGIVKGFNTEIANVSKSGAEMVADIEAADHTSKIQGFRDSAETIKQLASELPLYAGDEQITKAQDLQKLIDQRATDMVAYVRSIVQSLGSALASIHSLSDRMTHAGDTPEQRMASLRTQAYGSTGATSWTTGPLADIASATTPEDVLAISQAATQAIGQLYDALAQFVANATALRANIQGIADGFDPAKMRLASGGWPQGVDAYGAQIDTTWHRLMRASEASGNAQLNIIAQIRADALEMYQSQISMLRQIREFTAELHQSVRDQIHGIDYGNMTPGGKALDIESRLNAAREALKTATTPEEVRRLTTEIQQLGSTYLGLFSRDDPRRHAAEEWLKGVLRDTDTFGTQAYARLNGVITTTADQMRSMLLTATGLLDDSIGHASTEIEGLKDQLWHLQMAVDRAKTSFIDMTADTNTGLAPALQAAKTLFTDVNSVLGTTPGKVGNFNRGLDDAATALEDFVRRVNATGPAAGGEALPATMPGRTLDLLRRNPNLLALPTGQ
jgi:hypothetical protein